MLMNVDKPQNLYRMRNLQFQPSTTCIKMLPLQNQEPVLAHSCRHLGCQKNGFDGPLQNEEPATNLEVFSTKSGHPTPCFFGALPVSPENPEVYKNPFCRGNSCSTFPVFVKSI